jgi:hypothetical protein
MSSSQELYNHLNEKLLLLSHVIANKRFPASEAIPCIHSNNCLQVRRDCFGLTPSQ